MLFVLLSSRSIHHKGTKHTRGLARVCFVFFGSLLCINSYLSFNVVRLNSANNTATITNLNTILGSFQPEISK
jgi:hypothetical protein